MNYFQKMRKSLGDKRKELSDEHIQNLTTLYHDFADGPEVKVFDNTDFGFHRITVERPLQLNVQASDERIARLDERTWANLVVSKKKNAAAAAKEVEAGKATQAEALLVLTKLDATKLYMSRDVFLKDLKAAAKSLDIKLAAPIVKAVLSALSDRKSVV